jgi:release factor glutamine methyltransferase
LTGAVPAPVPETLHDALAAARTGLTEAGIRPAEAALDVDLYTCTLMGWDRTQLLVRLTDPVPEGLESRLSDWTARRGRGEPTAYIVGTKEFWGLNLSVSPAVLIPRPESEFIVEEALPLLEGCHAPLVADVGTGSGCLAIALATERDDCRVVATDISRPALKVARENSVRHGVAARITFVDTSFLDGVDGPFNVIMANPPYVRDGDAPALARPVKHEPEVALFGGSNGLDAIAATLAAGVETLAPGGWLVMEFGYGQDDEVAALVAARPGLRLDHVRHDLQGIPRTAVIQREGSAADYAMSKTNRALQ